MIYFGKLHTNSPYKTISYDLSGQKKNLIHAIIIIYNFTIGVIMKPASFLFQQNKISFFLNMSSVLIV